MGIMAYLSSALLGIGNGEGSWELRESIFDHCTCEANQTPLDKRAIPIWDYPGPFPGTSEWKKMLHDQMEDI